MPKAKASSEEALPKKDLSVAHPLNVKVMHKSDRNQDHS